MVMNFPDSYLGGFMNKQLDIHIQEKPLVSCIMIFYNVVECFFLEAIESVIAQTYDNWELLLIDDGSSDDGTQIARQYVRNYPSKIFYLEHPNHQNLGKSASRNLGLTQSKGTYLTFLDADDVYFPEQLDQQVKILELQPEAAMVWGRTQVWFSWTERSADQDRDCYSHFGTAPNCLVKPPMMLANLLDSHERAIPCVCSVLVRRTIVEELGGFENQFRDKFEDTVFWTKVFSSKAIFIVDHVWGRYRQHAANSCVIAMASGEWVLGGLSPSRQAYLNWVAEYLAKIAFQDVVVLKLLKQELWGYRHRCLYQFLRKIRHSLRKIRHSLSRAM
jgi:glycosyltransferase involved in cell wall biosynthesis